MNQILTQLCIIYIITAAFLLARPWLSRKNVLFGVVFGSSEIKNGPDVKNITCRFIVFSAVIAAAIAAAYFLYVYFSYPGEEGLTFGFILALFAMIALESIPYIWANRALKEWKETVRDENLVTNQITVEVGDDSKRKPINAAWFLLLLAPVIITVIVAAAYYPLLPDKVPVHFDMNGNADSWDIKSAGLVIGPIVSQIVLAGIMFLIGIFSRNAAASVKGSPGAAPGYPAFRRLLSFWIIVLSLVVETQFLFIELQYAGQFPATQAWNTAFIVLIIAIALVLMIAFFRMRREPEGKVYDDDSRWVLGMFYFNPSDPSVFVEKRSGIGQTINFGRPAAWIVIAVIVLFIVFAKFLKG